MTSGAATVEEYLAGLPEDRRAAIDAVREVIRQNLKGGYEETMCYGMIGYVVPHSIYPKGYHCDPKLPLGFLSLGSQKNYMSLHLMCAYGDAAETERLQQGFAAAGKKLDMGKACLRFKKVDDLALGAIGELIARHPVDKYVARVEKMLADHAQTKKDRAKA